MTLEALLVACAAAATVLCEDPGSEPDALIGDHPAAEALPAVQGCRLQIINGLGSSSEGDKWYTRVRRYVLSTSLR
jgi:hypothetical protein